jgi:hypothetical protein
MLFRVGRSGYIMQAGNSPVVSSSTVATLFGGHSRFVAVAVVLVVRFFKLQAGGNGFSGAGGGVFVV